MSRPAIAVFALVWLLVPAAASADTADLVLHHGKIVTVDPEFRVVEAIAIRGDRILEVGTNDQVLKLAGPDAQKIDLQGRTVLPGLNDTHLHPLDASVYEFDHEVPTMETVADVLEYVRGRAEALEDGQWIVIQQVYATRMRERRYPTRQELDEAAPKNPVFFRTGPDAVLNSLALELSGIDESFQITDGQPGHLERDPATGKLNGMLRSCTRLAKVKSPGKEPNDEDACGCLKKLMADYNAVGITSVTERDAPDAQVAIYRKARDRGDLTCRTFLTYYVDAQWPMEKIDAAIRKAAQGPLRTYDNRLWMPGIKIYLDGGMLTGSAYMLKPWGVSKIYSITDPAYRGVLFVEPEKLYQIARSALSNDMQLTAHTVGDGAVQALVEAYERVNRDFPIRDKRPCISHCNFMTLESIEKMAALGILADLQPAWLWHDGATLRANFGEERLTYFQPYKTLFDRGVIVGGGSDHMQKIGRRRSINTYDPFLGMWATLVRMPRWSDKPLHPEQCITRPQAIQLYTIHGAYLTFQEKEKGSLEKGKLADLIVLDKDILTCPVDEVADINVLGTWLGGKLAYHASDWNP
jgi:predicted amidohydrolase YtcJ